MVIEYRPAPLRTAGTTVCKGQGTTLHLSCGSRNSLDAYSRRQRRLVTGEKIAMTFTMTDDAGADAGYNAPSSYRSARLLEPRASPERRFLGPERVDLSVRTATPSLAVPTQSSYPPGIGRDVSSQI